MHLEALKQHLRFLAFLFGLRLLLLLLLRGRLCRCKASGEHNVAVKLERAALNLQTCVNFLICCQRTSLALAAVAAAAYARLFRLIFCCPQDFIEQGLLQRRSELRGAVVYPL